MSIVTIARRIGLAGFLALVLWSMGGSTAQAGGGFGHRGGGHHGGSFGRGYSGFGRSYGGVGRGYSGFGHSYGGVGRGYSGFGLSYGGFGGGYSGFGRGYGSGYNRYGTAYRGFGGYSNYGYSPSYSPVYRSNYYYPRSSVVGRSSYRISHAAPVVQTNAIVASPYPASTLNQGSVDQGWSMLASGNNQAALQYFGDRASRNTLAPEPKVGYAFAATAAGDVTTGAWAMRRALALDPNVIRNLHNKETMQGAIAQLAGQLHESLKVNPNQPDAGFVLAALDGAAPDQMAPTEMTPYEMKPREMTPYAGATDSVTMAKPPIQDSETQPEPLPAPPAVVTEPDGALSSVPSLPTQL